MSPSTRLSPFEHWATTALPLRAVASPPLVHATGFQRTFLGIIAGGHADAPTRTLQPRRPFGVCSIDAHGHLHCPCAPTSHGAGCHVRGRSLSAARFFHAYFEYRHHASIGYVDGHFQPLPFPLTTSLSLSTLTLLPASLRRPRPHLFVYTDNRGRYRHLFSPLYVSQLFWSLLCYSI
jgi:hypothetical protein